MQNQPIHISVVSPVYRAEKILNKLVDEIQKVMLEMKVTYEIILVDDRSPDNSWEIMEQLAAKFPEVKSIRLSKNFGQHYAITAGLDNCCGKWVVVMDCDLQDQPKEIIKLYNKAREGFDIVYARRAKRQDSFIKKISSKLFYKIYSYLSGMEQDGTVANFGIYNYKVIESVNRLREPMRAFQPMVRWVGFKHIAIDVEHAERFEGTSSYNWGKLINLALDIALAYSDRPLKLTVKLGVSISLISIFFALFSIVRYFLGYITQTGYTSLIVSIWFLSGLIIFTLGIIGLYVGKSFEGIKNRPIYLIDKKIN